MFFLASHVFSTFCSVASTQASRQNTIPCLAHGVLDYQIAYLSGTRGMWQSWDRQEGRAYKIPPSRAVSKSDIHCHNNNWDGTTLPENNPRCRSDYADDSEASGFHVGTDRHYWTPSYQLYKNEAYLGGPAKTPMHSGRSRRGALH